MDSKKRIRNILITARFVHTSCLSITSLAPWLVAHRPCLPSLCCLYRIHQLCQWSINLTQKNSMSFLCFAHPSDHWSSHFILLRKPSWMWLDPCCSSWKICTRLSCLHMCWICPFRNFWLLWNHQNRSRRSLTRSLLHFQPHWMRTKSMIICACLG
jgi:hypothetical protein